jgi:hypothetical protein
LTRILDPRRPFLFGFSRAECDAMGGKCHIAPRSCGISLGFDFVSCDVHDLRDLSSFIPFSSEGLRNGEWAAKSGQEGPNQDVSFATPSWPFVPRPTRGSGLSTRGSETPTHGSEAARIGVGIHLDRVGSSAERVGSGPDRVADSDPWVGDGTDRVGDFAGRVRAAARRVGALTNRVGRATNQVGSRLSETRLDHRLLI